MNPIDPRELLRIHGALPIVERVLARHPGVALEDLVDHARPAHITAARHEAWFLIRDELGWSYPRLARVFGFDHTTVMSGVRKCADAAGLVDSRGAA